MALDRTCVNVLLTISKIVKNTNFCDFMSVFFNLLKITHGSKQPLLFGTWKEHENARQEREWRCLFPRE